MDSILTFFLQGAAIGITAAGAPGTFQAFLISETLAGGWRRGFPIIFAPLISDVIIAPIIVFLVRQIPAGYFAVMRIAGAALLMYLAWGIWKQIKSNEESTEQIGNQFSKKGLMAGVVMNMLSPGLYLFWSLVNGPILLAGLEQSWLHGVAFVLGFYGVFISGNALIMFVFDRARKLGPRVVRVLTWITLVILLLFSFLLIKEVFI